MSANERIVAEVFRAAVLDYADAPREMARFQAGLHLGLAVALADRDAGARLKEAYDQMASGDWIAEGERIVLDAVSRATRREA